MGEMVEWGLALSFSNKTPDIRKPHKARPYFAIPTHWIQTLQYRLDLAPSNFHLLCYLKEFFGGRHVASDDKVKEVVEELVGSSKF